ncbi:hypothetical protein K1719_001068 [Acacia pycnantha]|nr:hypothetical protein K1719_001068 [Acacia pycnantha]
MLFLFSLGRRPSLVPSSRRPPRSDHLFLASSSSLSRSVVSSSSLPEQPCGCGDGIGSVDLNTFRYLSISPHQPSRVLSGRYPRRCRFVSRPGLLYYQYLLTPRDAMPKFIRKLPISCCQEPSPLIFSLEVILSYFPLSYVILCTYLSRNFLFNYGLSIYLPPLILNKLLNSNMKSTNLLGIGLAEAKVVVNKPELLPKEFSTVIDIVGFLSDGHEKRLAQEIASPEKGTGFKLRVFAQNYPETVIYSWKGGL